MLLRKLWIALFLLVFAACTSAQEAKPDAAAADATGADAATADATATAETAPGDAAIKPDSGPDATKQPDGLQARGSIRQVFVTHAVAGQAIELHDAAGALIAQAKADKLGSWVFRKVAPGQGYRVVATGDKPADAGPITVIDAAASLPSQAFYNGQAIKAGFGYITTRDGTTLSYFATLPGAPDKGPYPTVVNYSGYAPSQPGKPVVSKDQEGLCGTLPVLCAAPNDASALVMAVAGYATVNVNLRGTGCSGGAYDYFEELQLLDGYDVIETVAAQPWAMHHKVGMVGISYPGISQLFVAKAKPPSLAAIAPVSVIGNTATTLVPGGLLNMGFALNWITQVLDKAAAYGQGWEQGQVDAGDLICKENQLLHDQRTNNVEQAKDKKNWVPEVFQPLNPTHFVHEITVPVFLVDAWQDEQTGPFFFTLLDQFKSAPSRRFTLFNGLHADGFAPQVLVEWKAFLDLYVAKQVPSIPTFWGLAIPEFTKKVYGISVDLPPDRWGQFKTHADALAQWEKEPEVQVFFENGGAKPAGVPIGRWSVKASKWPVPEVQAQRWFFQPDGTLLPQAPTATGVASTFQLDPTAGERGIGAQQLWSATAKYDWKKPAAGYEVAFVTPVLDKDLVMLGTGSVDIWLRSPAADVQDADLEVNLSEIRPDGQEQYVQSGWLRASFRKLAATATELWPEQALSIDNAAPLESGKWIQVRVGIAGFGHAFRKGSRIRLAIDTPGDSRAEWRFELNKWDHPVFYDIGHSNDHASSVALPLLPLATVPADMAQVGCTLRGQPCRKDTLVPNVASKP